MFPFGNHTYNFYKSERQGWRSYFSSSDAKVIEIIIIEAFSLETDGCCGLCFLFGYLLKEADHLLFGHFTLKDTALSILDEYHF